ncbi:hypothetical protein DIPPA_23059 [Diplonema papillatum]|nr:hypothetical protein DIPPA_23059 [Diplonema papillatum]
MQNPNAKPYVSGGRVLANKPIYVRAIDAVVAFCNMVWFFIMSMLPGQSLREHRETLVPKRS